MSFNKGKETRQDSQRGEFLAEDTIYVAVSKEVKENKLILKWALQNSGGKSVCIIHVHQPAQRIPTPIGYMPANRLGEQEVKAYRAKEREEMTKVLEEYLRICQRSGARIEKIYIEADSIEKGIIQLIEHHRIGKLVMGAAADKHHSRKMTDLRSNKAVYVRENAPPSCHIWFVCNGYLIHTREAIKTKAGGNENVIAKGNEGASPTAPPFDIRDLSPPRWSTDSNDGLVSRTSSARETVTGLPGRLLSQSSPLHQSFMSRNESGNLQGTPAGLEILYIEECRRRKETEAELARVKAELEWMKNQVTELPKKNEELEYAELAKVKAELEYMRNNVLGELTIAVEQKALLENQIGNSTFLLQMLGEKLGSAINLVHNYGEQ